MKKLSEMKKEYEGLEASGDLRLRLDSVLKNARPGRRKAFRLALAAACAIAVFIGTCNVVPGVACALSEVPVLGKIVQVVTLGRFEMKDKSYAANVDFPQLRGLSDQDVENQVNADLKNQSNALIAAFEKDIADWKAKNPNADPHLALDHGYKVLTDDDLYFRDRKSVV